MPQITPDPKPKRNSKKLHQVIAGLSAAGGTFAAGLAFGWSAPVHERIARGGEYSFAVSDAEFSWVSSAVLLGAATGSIPNGFLLNITGSRLTMLLLAIPLAIGWIAVTYAQNVLMMCAGRFLLGVAGGAFCVIVPLYTTEIAIIEIRGTIGSFSQLLFMIGVLLAYTLGAFVTVFTFNLTIGIVSVVFVVLFGFMPESPSFLVTKNKDEKLAKTLQWLRGKDYDISAELTVIKSTHSSLLENPVPMRVALCRRSTRKALFLSTSLMVLLQMTGTNAILFYSTTIFREANIGFSANLTTIMLGGFMLIGTILALLTVDKLGRRPLLLLSNFSASLTTLALGVYFYMKEREKRSVESIHWLPVVSICIYEIVFSIGIAPVAWLFMAEIFTNDVKSIAASIVTTTNWCFAFLITNTFLVLKNVIGSSVTFFIFSAITFFGTIFIFCYIPETKGKSLYAIQKELAGIVDELPKPTQLSAHELSDRRTTFEGANERNEQDIEYTI